MTRRIFSALLTIALTFSSSTATYAADATKYKNCTALNKSYPGGIAKTGATDTTKKNGKVVVAKPKKSPVVDDAVYAKNKSLDRDKDGVACEK